LLRNSSLRVFSCSECETSFWKSLNTIATMDVISRVSFIFLLFVHRCCTLGNLDFSTRFLSAICRECTYRYGEDYDDIIM
jgi:hypothetical protein